MKKIFTLAAAALFTCAANAQVTPNIETEGVVQKINDNLVFYMCTPGQTEVSETPAAYLKNTEATAFEELGISLVDNNADNTNQVVVTQDYVDPETGAKFPKGYYIPAKVGGSRTYFGNAAGGATGMKNVKKMIFYWAAAGQVQFSSYLVREGGTTVPNESTGVPVSDPARYTMDPNCKMKFIVPEIEGTVMGKDADGNNKEYPIYCSSNYYNTKLDDQGNPTTTWTTFACTRPCKLTLDFTENIDKELIDTNLDFSQETSGDVTVPYGHHIWAKRGADGKDVAGEPIAWAAENILQQGYKRAAYLLGIAIISGNDGAQTYYANISNSTDDDECYWEAEAEAAHADLIDTDEPEYNLYFSWLTTPEFKDLVKQNVQPDAVKGIASTTATTNVLYNIAGQKVSDSFKGIVIENGKKVIK